MDPAYFPTLSDGPWTLPISRPIAMDPGPCLFPVPQLNGWTLPMDPSYSLPLNDGLWTLPI